MTESNFESKDKPGIVKLDDILKEFKVTDKYHVITLTLLSLSFITNFLYTMNYIFVAPDVNYRCQYTECNGSSLTNLLNISSSKECLRYVAKKNATCIVNDFYLNKTQACHNWIYDNPSSFVAEFDLGCQDWKRTLIGSAHGFGLMFGLIMTGMLSDRFGRKVLIVTYGIMGAVVGIAKSMTSYYWLYVFLEFVEPIVGDTISPAFTMAVESAPPGKRITFSTLLTCMNALGATISVLVTYFLPYWRHYLLAIYIPALLHVLHAFYLNDSVRWLMTKGRKDEAIKVIKKMAKSKNITIDENKLQSLEVKEIKKISLISVLKVTLSSKVLVIRFVVCVIWWTSMIFMNYGTSINLYSMNGNIHMFYGLMTIIDITAFNLSAYIQTRLQKKKPLIFLFYSAGGLFIIQAFNVTSGTVWLSTTLFLAGRFFTMILYAIVYLFTSELFPTYTRNTMHALCSSIARIGSIVAPQTPLLTDYWAGLPSLLFGCAAVIAASCTFLVPDTVEESLPDTVAEAENIGTTNK